MNCELNTGCKAAERGQEGQFAPGPRGLVGLIIEDFSIFTAGNVLKRILVNLKGTIEKILCSLRSQGASFHNIAPWASKTSRRPRV